MVLDRVSIEINIIIFFFKNTNFFFTRALSHPYFFYNLYSFPPVLGIRRVEQGQGDVFWVRLEPISGQTLLDLVQITLAQMFPAQLSLLQKESRCLERPVLGPGQEKDGEVDLDQVLHKSLKIWSWVQGVAVKSQNLHLQSYKSGLHHWAHLQVRYLVHIHTKNQKFAKTNSNSVVIREILQNNVRCGIQCLNQNWRLNRFEIN